MFIARCSDMINVVEKQNELFCNICERILGCWAGYRKKGRIMRLWNVRPIIYVREENRLASRMVPIDECPLLTNASNPTNAQGNENNETQMEQELLNNVTQMEQELSAQESIASTSQPDVSNNLPEQNDDWIPRNSEIAPAIQIVRPIVREPEPNDHSLDYDVLNEFLTLNPSVNHAAQNEYVASDESALEPISDAELEPILAILHEPMHLSEFDAYLNS